MDPILRPGVEPGLAASKTAVPPTHSQSRQCPRQESNLVYDLRKVACASGTLQGHSTNQQGCKDSNPVRECWKLAALPGAHPCRAGAVGPCISSQDQAVTRIISCAMNRSQLATRAPWAT